MSDEDVLLEEGTREHATTNAKDKRKSFAATINATYLHYEKVVKTVVIAIVGAWVVIVLAYVVFAPKAHDHDHADANVLQTTGNGGRGIAEDAFPLSTRFLVIGDYGTGDESQIKVAQAFKKHAASLDPRPAFVISAGDQVYEHGSVCWSLLRIASLPLRLAAYGLTRCCAELNPLTIQSSRHASKRKDAFAGSKFFDCSSLNSLIVAFLQMYEHPNLQIPWYITYVSVVVSPGGSELRFTIYSPVESAITTARARSTPCLSTRP
ncbi:hypothetical protein PINS_up001334 [Pythium insidiosum]|nr:hypothetical protein PINS_up001334 [Pythium insidiosum]